MNRGDYVVRFETYRSVGAQKSTPALASTVHRGVQPVVHASGALTIERPSQVGLPTKLIVVYGPGAWQSIAPLEGESVKEET